ncbi:MAG: UDP-N-acetylmuramoyl-L-alanyl-D-glutamate--2,6-diaminopimelate ligase [Puniceicoccales bacterium]|jgi:UDP-N-acetylmuramoyl-L-alanyl-D-glutamate--2,6-diaminopimelate ligase|nr:UDP-N-acetylmuramoyl-L-alanyl-D-glutamate--2,6-diaminopimelate ligase [Puniceicoccales bacterium]
MNNTAITLREVFHNLELREFSGEWTTPVSNLVIDSRRVINGSVFFATPGLRTNGEFFIEEAVARGAAAIVSSSKPSSPRTGLAWIRVDNPRAILAAASSNFFRNPSKKLRVAGVTGTNGKTTVSTLLHYLLCAAQTNSPWGLIGTVRYELGDRSLPSHRTTPESPEIHSMMAHMVAAGCSGLVMEVSSHAIDQRRVDGIAFDSLAFTNISHDHIDYHGGLENYFQVKTRPFLGNGCPLPAAAVINNDDPAGRRLASMLPPKHHIETFGESPDSTVRASDILLLPGRSEFTVQWRDTPALRISTSLPGRYNVSNILCALALARTLGFDPASLLPALRNFPGVPGRMERIAPNMPFQIFVDYAHTDDALQNTLEMLRSITPGRILVVFGCGGDRDHSKRSTMTAAVQHYAALAWATADNPRKEPLENIFNDMRAGISHPEKITFVDDRRLAISLALDAANAGDTLLIAGKGHETYQEFADVTIPFDDRQVTRDLLALKQLRPI